MKIIYIHPAIRSYRKNLFIKLQKDLNIDFFWSSSPKIGYNSAFHEYNEIMEILRNVNIHYYQGKEIHKLPFDNFSFDLLKLPFMEYDIYIFSNILSTPYLLLAPILKSINKKIIIFDELWRYPKEVKKYKLIYSYVKFLAKYCLDGAIVAGSKAKEFYMREFNFPQDKIEIAYNTTVDTKELVGNKNIDEKIKNKLNAVTKRKKILYLGRIVKYKGLDILIKAMQKVKKEYDLIVVGDGEFRKECEGLVNKLGLNDRVHFLGSCYSYEAPYYYKNSDIFVLPTRFRYDHPVQIESWGFTVNEAMALEKPVVATTAVGSAYDLIIDGVTGALATAGDVESLAKKINFIIDNNKDNIIGKNARRHLLKICNYEQNLEAYKRLIEKILKE